MSDEFIGSDSKDLRPGAFKNLVRLGWNWSIVLQRFLGAWNWNWINICISSTYRYASNVCRLIVPIHRKNWEAFWVSMFVSNFDEAMWARTKMKHWGISYEVKDRPAFSEVVQGLQNMKVEWCTDALTPLGDQGIKYAWVKLKQYNIYGNIGNFHCRSQIETNQQRTQSRMIQALYCRRFDVT